MAVDKKPKKVSQSINTVNTKRKARKGKAPFKESFYDFEPKTENQRNALCEWVQNQNLVLHGFAGTGKTFIALAMALKTIYDPNTEQDNILIVRSTVPTQDIGFLPGTFEEKIAPYEEPYRAVFEELFKIHKVYDSFKDNGILNFVPMSFLRGITFHNSVIIVDECQNANFHMLDSAITRVGDDSRIIFCGDYTQSDLSKKSDKEGVVKFMEVLAKLDQFSHIEFGEQDIVRSRLVKDYIIAKHRLGIE